MFDFFKKSSVELTETESLENRAMTELRKGNDGDATYHPLYLAWRSFQRNPEQLTRIQDFATFGMGLTTFLSYETVSDIDEKQQISSIAYLFLSLAILKNKDDVSKLVSVLKHTEKRQHIALRNEAYFKKVMECFPDNAVLFFANINIDKYISFLDEYDN
jgi:hypothetical protein